MPSYVLTGAPGAPGAGKTAILRLLQTSGYPVVEEAATDIALGHARGRDEPWQDPGTKPRLRMKKTVAAYVEATAARRISFQDSLVFERLHEQVYRDFGFQLVDVPAGPLADRAALIQRTVSQATAGQLRFPGPPRPRSCRRAGPGNSGDEARHRGSTR